MTTESGTADPATPKPSKPKLTRLKIERFRNVAPCELRFGEGFNVLLGLNATGKTTLLELIVACLRFDFSKFVDEGFAVDYDLSFSTGTIAASIKNEPVAPPPPNAPVLQVRDRKLFALSTRLHIRFTSPIEEWTVCADETSIWIEESPERKLTLQTHLGEHGPGLLLRAVQIDYRNALLQAYMNELGSWARVRRFDEALDLFRDLTSPSTWIEVAVDRTKAKPEGFNFNGMIPGELLGACAVEVMKMPDAGQGLTIPAGSLSFLSEVSALFGFKTARLEMRLESKVGRTVEVLKFSDFRFMFEDQDGSVIRHDDLSYGQKRLLAFYYYLAASPMTVIADELVDGLHHIWIDAAIDTIGDRQAFLASQNPLLLDHLDFDSAEQVASTFITCRTERSGDGNDKQMLWSNMSTYDAERFFRAYQVDVQHVSEILLSKGLW